MKKILWVWILIISLTSCKDGGKVLEKKATLEPVTDVSELTSDFRTWWTYHYNNIALPSDFTALDEDSEVIPKERFLKRLTSGRLIPVEMKTDSAKIYKLYILPANVDKDISSTIKNVSTVTYELHKMQGKKFPEFDLVDLKGDNYTNESFEGKTTILKTWFIACKPCVQEMPVLNELVDKQRNNDQIQFLSLALDEEKALEKFLKKIEFKYAVAAEQREFITKKLNLTTYPTHIVINEKGEIERVYQKASDLIAFLEEYEPMNNNSDTGISLPPQPASGEDLDKKGA